MVTTDLCNAILDAFFNQGARPTLYLGLLGPESEHTVPLGDGSFEVIAYDQPDRPAWTPGPSDLVGVRLNTFDLVFYYGSFNPVPCEFTFDKIDSVSPGVVITGFFVSDVSTKGDPRYLSRTEDNYTIERRDGRNQVTERIYSQLKSTFGPFYTYDVLKITYSIALTDSGSLEIRERYVSQAG